jgi:hypothetical protein
LPSGYERIKSSCLATNRDSCGQPISARRHWQTTSQTADKQLTNLSQHYDVSTIVLKEHSIGLSVSVDSGGPKTDGFFSPNSAKAFLTNKTELFFNGL